MPHAIRQLPLGIRSSALRSASSVVDRLCFLNLITIFWLVSRSLTRCQASRCKLTMMRQPGVNHSFFFPCPRSILMGATVWCGSVGPASPGAGGEVMEWSRQIRHLVSDLKDIVCSL